MPIPDNELQRLTILRRYSILDTPQEAHYDRVCWLAANHFQAPIAVITFVDRDRQWFKASLGLDVQQTDRTIAFCDHTIRGDDVFEVRTLRSTHASAKTPWSAKAPASAITAGHRSSRPVAGDWARWQ